MPNYWNDKGYTVKELAAILADFISSGYGDCKIELEMENYLTGIESSKLTDLCVYKDKNGAVIIFEGDR